jgi:hypothetical protein
VSTAKDARRSRRLRAAALLVAGLAAAWAACGPAPEAALTQLMEARRLAADMRVQLHRSAGGAQRAVMADADDVAAGFAREAEEATRALEQDLQSLEPILERLRYADELALAREFGRSFAELRALDRSLLALAVENSNAKAQRLAFGPAREAADAFCARLEAAARSAPRASALRAGLLAARAELAVREIQALQAPHIAEAEDAVMTRLEEQMAASEAAARASLEELSRLLDPAVREELASGREQLERFAAIHRDLVALSRQNTDVRSLAVALGNKRRLTAACDETLVALQDALAKRGFHATR